MSEEAGASACWRSRARDSGLVDSRCNTRADGHRLESVVQLGERTLGVAIDTNFPNDAGRRAGVPDDIELIRIELEAPLSSLTPPASVADAGAPDAEAVAVTTP